MERALFVLLLSLLCVGTLAQQAQTQTPSYSLNILMVSDSHPAETLWLVDGANPNVAHKSLHAPGLLKWVSTLPKGTRITYRSPWLGLPMFGTKLSSDTGTEKEIDTRTGKEIDVFGDYCRTKGIIFLHETAANVPIL